MEPRKVTIVTRLKFALFVGILLFLGYQYFRIYMLGGFWVPHGNPETYSVAGADGRSLTLVFMPLYKLLSVYMVGTSACFELSKISGDFGNKVFWRVWHVDNPRWWRRYRVVAEGYDPVLFQQDVLVRTGSNCQVFPPAGSLVYFNADFSKHTVKYRGMELDKEAGDPVAIEQIERALEHLTSEK